MGVGHADRELTGLVHGNLPPAAQLARVIEIVRAQRRVGAERHPLNQLAPERWLRANLVADPARIGLAELRSAPPAVPRPNLRDPAIAVAVGVDPTGADVVVACSVGVHLDLIPAAADARLALAPDARLLLVVPERDAHPVTRALADRLVAPRRARPPRRRLARVARSTASRSGELAFCRRRPDCGAANTGSRADRSVPGASASRLAVVASRGAGSAA